MLLSRLTPVISLFLFLVLGSSSFADVYVNRLWDEQSSSFKVKVLDLKNGGITFDRDYQNAYGELHKLDPGPPFFIEAAIIGAGEIDGEGKVVSFSSLSFVSGGLSLTKPFNVYFMPGENQEGRVSINGPVNFDGSSFDPIKVTGAFEINAGHPGGTDPWNTGQHSMIWRSTEFSSPVIHQNTWNYNPVNFNGGHVSLQDCYFKGFDGFATIISFYPTNGNSPAPLWDLTIDNCRIEDDSLTYLPMIFNNLRRVDFSNNYFKNNQFAEYSLRGIVVFDECGIGRMVMNSAGKNDHNLIRVINSWVSDSAFVRTDPSLPIVFSALPIPEDSALAIGRGSIIKFYHSGGFAVDGRLWVDSAILTSFNDDTYGGDSDLDSVQGYIYHWSPDTPGHTGAISVSPTGYANIRGSKIFYPEGAVYAQALVDIYATDIRHSDGFGIWLKSHGNESYTIRKVTLRDNAESGYASDYPFMLDNAQGGNQRLWLDSVQIFDGQLDGAVIRTNSGTSNNVKITSCTFTGNDGHGLTVELWPQLDTVEIDNCTFAANGYNGLHTSDFQGDSIVFILSNSLFAGNGHLGSLRTGANVRAGIPLFVNNTFAYNNQMGLNLYEVARDRVRTINNLFYRNGSYGYVLTDPGTSYLSHNAFFANRDGVQEVYYRLPSGLVKTIEEIQAEGGDFATNLHVDPQLSAEIIGSISSLRYDTAGLYSVITGPAGAFAGKTLRGTIVCPDTTQSKWFWVAANTADSLYVDGDAGEVASVGSTFRLFDHHLLDISPLVDAGDLSAFLGQHDIDGNVRTLDGDGNGSHTVDIGADEYNPNGGNVSPIRITKPSAASVFMIDDTCCIEWEAGGIDSVTILFTENLNWNPPFWDTLARGVNAAQGELKTMLPYATSNECVIRVEDAANGATYDLVSPVTVKPYTLTDLDDNGNMIEYSVADHSWPFGNFPDKMWPAAWYNQFDYKTAVDTITGMPYPPYFADSLYYNAKPQDFPDWQLWVQAFGLNECYIHLPTGYVYLPTALARWSDLKGAWRGSCFGFGIGNAMGFFDSAGFRSAYPLVDPYNHLHDLALNNDHRLLVNQLLLHQFGSPHTVYKNAHINDSPRELIVQLKELLGRNFTVGRVLGIGNSRRGGHAVNPYRLEEVLGSPGRYHLYIYDSNHPDTTGAYVERYITLDSVANTWEYSDMPGWNDANGYCFLMDSASLYYNHPHLTTSFDKAGSFAQSAAGRKIEIYTPGATQVVIVDAHGDTTGLIADSVINDITSAMPIIPMTGYPASPIGYTLVDGPYSMSLASDSSTTIAASIWRDSTLFRYSRTGVDPLESDVLTTDTGLSFSNLDTTAKTCQLLYLQKTPTQERQYVFTGLTADSAQGFKILASDDSTVSLLNRSGGTQCTVELWLVSADAATIVVAENVTLPTDGLATLIPNWDDPTLHDILLARDMNGDGTAEDTTALNVVTTVGDAGDATLPGSFSLSQNYPNPFNLTTVIRYNLPRRCHVTIDIYNILGRKVRTLVDETLPAGSYTVDWNGTTTNGETAATGVYLYRMTTDDFTSTRKMLLLK